MTKKLFDILGEDLPFQNALDKKFSDLHAVKKVRGLSGPTDNDEIFNATNVKTAKRLGDTEGGKDPMIASLRNEGVMDVYSSIGGVPQGDPNDEDAQRNQAIQDNMQAAQQYKQQGAGHTQLAANHSQIGNDMNQDSKLRNLHKGIADLQTQLSNSYGKLSKYHDNQMQSAINGGN